MQLTLDIYTGASIMDWGAAVDKLPTLEARSGDKTVTGSAKAAQVQQNKVVAAGVA